MIRKTGLLFTINNRVICVFGFFFVRISSINFIVTKQLLQSKVSLPGMEVDFSSVIGSLSSQSMRAATKQVTIISMLEHK